MYYIVTLIVTHANLPFIVKYNSIDQVITLKGFNEALSSCRTLTLQKSMLPHDHWLTLGFIVKHQGCNQVSVAKAINRSKSAITQIVDSLVNDDLVLRIQDEANRRANILKPTPKGIKLFEQSELEIAQSLESRFNTDDLAKLQRLIELAKELTQRIQLKC
jgi:DNA-binding MarR family transcriptional regulator